MKHPELCFECAEGCYEEILIDYPVKTPSMDEQIVLKEVMILRCNKCGEELMPQESSKRIDEIVVRYRKEK